MNPSTATLTRDLTRSEARRSAPLRDAWVIARRGLWHMRRHPEALADATLQPIMLVLVFAYVFGGAIAVPGGGNYKEFLLAGIFAQSVVFGGSIGVAIGIATDRTNGVTDRFRALPMARSALLAGRAVAHLLKALVPLALITACGLAIGWRIRGGIIDATTAYALLIVFAFAIIWIGVLVGSLVSSPDAVQGVSLAVVFPLTFIAGVFVPANTLPGVLRTFAEWNPVTTLTESLRTLFANPHNAATASDPWSLQHPIAYTLIACAAIIAICAPLAIRRYQQSIEH
jgi:ABC-2 type transport system permease protein